MFLTQKSGVRENTTLLLFIHLYPMTGYYISIRKVLM